MRYLWLLGLMLAAGVASPAIAQDRRLVTSGCRQGNCNEVYWLEQRLIHQSQLGGITQNFYEVKLESHNNYSGVKQYVQWVQCSVREPFVAFQGSPDLIYFNYLNPGSSDVFGYQSGAHQLYWAVCHNMWDVELMASGLSQEARQLGYPLNLPTEQRSIPRVMFGF